MRSGIEEDLAEAERRDPLKRMAKWLMDHGLATGEDLAKLAQEEDQRLEDTFGEVLAELK